MQTSKFCLLFLRVNDWKDAFLRGFNPNYIVRGCCVCLVWHRICLIPFSVSVALSESFLWSVNLNVIAWPNHYKSGFVGIFSYKAGAVQGYLLYSFMEELIEVNLPLSSQNAPRGTGFVLVSSLLGSAILWSWVAAQPSLCLPQASLCIASLAGGTSGTSASGQGHSTAAAPSVICPFTWVSILLFSKWKMFLYFTCWPENVRFCLQMTWRCLKYILSLRQKKMYWIIFLMCFLGKVMCDCKNENTLFPAQNMIDFKMWGKTPNQNTKKQPQTWVC